MRALALLLLLALPAAAQKARLPALFDVTSVAPDGMSDALLGFELNLIEVGYGSYTRCCTLTP